MCNRHKVAYFLQFDILCCFCRDSRSLPPLLPEDELSSVRMEKNNGQLSSTTHSHNIFQHDDVEVTAKNEKYEETVVFAVFGQTFNFTLVKLG